VDRCAGCGFDYELDRAELAARAIRVGAGELADVLERDDLDLRTRRRPEQWSPLEYGCHVRDVLLVQRERVLMARSVETPSFDPMNRDLRVEFDGYAEQDPHAVARQLRDAALLFTNVLARFGPDDWERHVMYNYPAPWERSLRWVAVHTQHEIVHHLRDVRGQLA
jgi:DinB family protein